MFKIKLNEQSAKLSDYKFIAYNLEDDILNHCSYFLLYDMAGTENHWKKELYGFCFRLKKIDLKSGDKASATYLSLVEMAHGKDFCEDIADPQPLFESIYESEEIPHPFSYDMGSEHNRDVYFGAMLKFYTEFLIPWISSSDKTDCRQSLYDAVDAYLCARRADMV